MQALYIMIKITKKKGKLIMFYFTNEIVFVGHPDKICDQISDALLDAYMKQDPNTRAGIETVGGKGKIFITGEVTSSAEVDVYGVVYQVLDEVGYDISKYEVVVNLSKQSPDIAKRVNVGGAGDNGMMVGFACTDTQQHVRTAQAILQDFAQSYETARIGSELLKSDGKAQITGLYDENWKLLKIKDFVVCYQNTETDRKKTDGAIRGIVYAICYKYNVEVENIIINPTERFELGGFEADAGLTGRKIVVDSYQGFAPVGGGAFSGKDPSKVDRSGAYMARRLALKYLKNHELKWCQVQLSYAIGLEEPRAIYITSNKGVIEADAIDYERCKPQNIIKFLDLHNVKFEDTAKFGHFGRGFAWDSNSEIE